MANLIGQRLGQYQITALLGRGGMATVYRARQTSIDRDVAVKVIKPDLIESEEFKVRFNREAKVIAALSHPHILKVFDYGQHGDVVYLVMELLSGGSLADLLRGGARLEPAEVARLLDQIASALDYAHRRGIVHRDLKPQNVLLDEERNALLTDFGIAKLLSETTALTQSGIAMGTPAYMSPEQWRGQSVDGRADVYALGAMLYEMLAGRVPFMGDTPYSMMHMHIFEALPNIRTARPELPEAVQSVLSVSMAKDRELRFNTAGEMANAFKLALAGVAVPPRTSEPAADVTAPVPVGGAKLDAPTTREPVSSALPSDPPIKGATPLGLAAEPARKPARRLPLVLGAVIVALIGLLAALSALGGDQGGAVAQTTPTQSATAPTETALALAPTETLTSTPSSEPTSVAAVVTETQTATLTATLTPTQTATHTASFTATATSTATATATPTLTLTPTPSPDLIATERFNLRNTAQAQVEARQTEAAATLQFRQTRLAQLQLTGTARAARSTATAVALALTATAQALSDNATAVRAARATAQAQQTRLAQLQLTGTARAARSTATAVALAQPSGRIIFHTDLNGRWEINQVTLPDGTFTRLTDGRGVYYLPSFSADGQFIALSSSLTGAIEIFIMRADGTGLRRISTQGGENWAAALSPNGQQVVWHSNRPGTFRLFIANTDGTGVRQLTQRDPQGRSLDTDASWAPDGRRIVFSSLRKPDGLYFLDVETGALSYFPAAGDDAGDPSWSPDGQRIAFQSGRDGNLNIYVINVDGTGLRRLTDHPAADGRPAWSPDGQWIAFESDRDGKLDIYIMRPDGSDVRRITSNPGKNGWASWAR